MDAVGVAGVLLVAGLICLTVGTRMESRRNARIEAAWQAKQQAKRCECYPVSVEALEHLTEGQLVQLAWQPVERVGGTLWLLVANTGVSNV
jgi:hypothetical protein